MKFNKSQIARGLIPILGVLCLTPWMSSALALLSGIAIAIVLGNPYADFTRRYTPKLLTWSVMGLGAGMNLLVVVKVGIQGFAYTIIGISLTLFLGHWISKWLGVEKVTAVLVSVGTAICGGSAIAAVAPTLRAPPQAISVALGTVFLLNALALLLFPMIGHWFDLTEVQFGLWAALAIHDTSSVVGASMQYGREALQIGTTVKLARALWIVPLALTSGWIFARKSNPTTTKHKLPLFILGFIIMAAVVTFIPELQAIGHRIEIIAKRTLVLTLFFIGANLTLSSLKSVGIKPLVLGILLWMLVASGTLTAILAGWIH